MHSLTSHRYRRIEESPVAVFSALKDTTPLHLHARNWMAEMAAITPLTESYTSGDCWFPFPEQGINLSLASVQHLHSVAIDPLCGLRWRWRSPRTGNHAPFRWRRFRP